MNPHNRPSTREGKIKIVKDLLGGKSIEEVRGSLIDHLMLISTMEGCERYIHSEDPMDLVRSSYPDSEPAYIVTISEVPHFMDEQQFHRVIRKMTGGFMVIPSNGRDAPYGHKLRRFVD